VVIGRGSRWETPEQSGWAHLLEHMVFKGAGDRSARDIVEAIEAEGGQINAATGYERTSFQVRALKGGLPLAMAVIADLVKNPTLGADDLRREKLVVAQEIAEANDTPDDLVFEMAHAAAFAGQSLGRPILGADATVAAASRETLARFHAGFYAPDALVIGAAGAVDEGELLALAQQLFDGPVAAAPPPGPAPAKFTAGQAAVSRPLEQAQLVLMLPAPSTLDPDYFALRLFAEILGGGMSSRLFQEVREHRGLAYAIDAFADTQTDTGVLGVYAGASPKDAAEAARVAAGQIEAMTLKVHDAELARAKAQLKAATFMARESVLSRAEQAAGQLLTFGRLFTVAETAAAIDSVSVEDVQSVGGRMLAASACACAVLGPKRALDAGAGFQRALFG
jgi:predicted Zn-dependent peptidase